MKTEPISRATGRSRYRRSRQDPARLRALRLLPRHARPMRVLGDELDSPRGRIYPISETVEAGQAADARGSRAHRSPPFLSCLHDHLLAGRQLHALSRSGPREDRADYSRPLTERLPRAVLARVLPRFDRFA